MPDLNLSVRFSLRKYSSKASLDVITPVESKIEDISEAELPCGILTFIICLTYAMNSLFTGIQVDLHIL